MKVIIMAGGKGTRIQSISSDIPKPMIPINGIPVLETELCSLRNQGFNEFIFTVGHLAIVLLTISEMDLNGMYISNIIAKRRLLAMLVHCLNLI